MACAPGNSHRDKAVGPHRHLIDYFRGTLDVWVGKDVVFVGATRAELRDHRAFWSTLEPVPGVWVQGVLVTGTKHDFVPNRIVLFAVFAYLKFAGGKEALEEAR